MKHRHPIQADRCTSARWRWLATLALLAGALAGGPARAGQFAASPLATAPTAGVGAVRTLLALLLVLALIFAAAWLLRRMRGSLTGGNADLSMLAQLSVGQRERVVWVRARDQQLLLGVAPGSVRLLLSLDPDARTDAPAPDAAQPDAPAADAPVTVAAERAARPSFRALLLRSLGQ